MKYSEIYRSAFEDLKTCYPKALLMCLVSIVITSGPYQLIVAAYKALLTNEYLKHSISAILLIFVIYLAAVIGIYFFTDVINAGKAKFLMQSKLGEVRPGYMFFFLNGHGNAVKVLWRKYIHILLATLMLVIPGVIVGYDLMLVPYMLCDVPEMPKDRAVSISERAMEGYKWKCFVLTLPFSLVSMTTAIISYLLSNNLIVVYVIMYVLSLFIQPLQLAVMQEFYEFMKGRILAAAMDINEEEGKTRYTEKVDVIEMYTNGSNDGMKGTTVTVKSQDYFKNDGE